MSVHLFTIVSLLVEPQKVTELMVYQKKKSVKIESNNEITISFTYHQD